MASDTQAARIEAVRHFNRFYTRAIGVLREGLLDSAFSLAEARVLYELAHRERPTAGALARDLGLDAGYLSRILRRFERKRLITRKPVASDRRAQSIALAADGRAAFRVIDARSRNEVRALLTPLPDAAQATLIGSMSAIERTLSEPDARPSIVLRTHRPGDFGWIVQRHGELYALEYGWDERFEGLVAQIVATIVASFDPRRERCWIAEIDGQRAGSVCLVRKSAAVAQLRLLLVEPAARGVGLGHRLVDECTAFARSAGYRTITLWTQRNLVAARRIYVAAGYELVASESHARFGHALVGETWELSLK